MAKVGSILNSTMVRYMDPDKTTWSDAELLSMLQRGVDYIQQLLISRNDITGTKSGTITLLDGVGTYSLATNGMSDFVAMYRGERSDESGVWIDDKFLLPCRQTEAVNYSGDEETEPDLYYITSTSLGVLPIPDTSYSLVCLYFYKQPPLVRESDMPYNDVFNMAIATFVDAMASARNEQDVSVLTQLYNELESSALIVSRSRTPIVPTIRYRKS
jgi:hypothetical protein